ncbi:MAG: DUF502 domain-containing protein [Burkholderiaceae bacterium]|nr:DUF502 domain-containing protein [Burkholderiaceae bacterium]
MRKYFITGLLILVPFATTLWVLHAIISTMDQSLLLLPPQWRPEQLVGFKVLGIGTILTLLIVFLTGLLAQNFIGNFVIEAWESALKRIPIVNSIYSSVKQVSDTLFSSSGTAFSKAILVRFPHTEAWTIGFLTGVPSVDVSKHFLEEHISVYIPTTPNPTSGYFLIVPKAATIELEMSVDEALKYVVSMGVVVPEHVRVSKDN